MLKNNRKFRNFIADGIYQELSEDGTPTTSFIFDNRVWAEIYKLGYFKADDRLYVFRGPNAMYNAIGAIHEDTTNISFWPKRSTSKV